MTLQKFCTTIVSPVVLMACTSMPDYRANIEDWSEEKIVCKWRAPIGSNIKKKTCRAIRNLSFWERRDLIRDAYGAEPFEMRPKR